MFSGEDVSTIVIDVGTNTTKAGYAGEDHPRFVIPSAGGIVYHKGSDSTIGQGAQDMDAMDVDNGAAAPKVDRSFYVGLDSTFRRDNMEIKHPLTDGLVTDWDVVEKIYDHIFSSRFHDDPHEHPILLSECSYNTPANREKATEILFEKFGVPAMFVAKNAVLTTFASGRANSLVLELGAGMTTATPVHDGYVLSKHIEKSTLGGNELTNYLRHIMAEKNIDVVPQYLIQRKQGKEGDFQVTVKEFPHTSRSYHEYMLHNLLQDLKEAHCMVSKEKFETIHPATAPVAEPYHLPDGKVVRLGLDVFRIPEFLFNPSLVPVRLPRVSLAQSEWRTSNAGNRLGVQQMIVNAIGKSDVDIRKEFFRGIIVSGGGSLFNGFVERLNTELVEIVPQQMKKEVKLIAPAMSAERKYSTFIGGSILGSLGTFQKMWMSKSEYAEHGKGLVERKCP